MKRDRVFRYCKLRMIDDAIRLGWVFSATMHQPHGSYMAILEWQCDCPAPWPCDPRNKTEIPLAKI